MRELVYKYVEQGYCIFPCNENKTPATQHGFRDAHMDLDLLYKQFWNTDFLIGLPTGNVNKIVVIDIDIKDGRTVDELKEELKQYGDFPETLEVETMSGGRHLIYSVEETNLSSKVRFFDKTLPVDIRANGGYICAPDFKKYFPLDCEGIEDLSSLIKPLPVFVENYQKPNEYVEQTAGAVDLLPPAEVRELRSALSFIDSDDRDMWVKIGHALKSIGSPQAKGIFVEYSKTSEKYDEKDTERKWKTFKPNEITIASIFGIAKGFGWTTTYEKAEPEALTPEQLEIKVLDFNTTFNKKPFPEDLLRPAGFVGDVVDYMNSQALKEQPILALAGSLAFAGALMGRRYRTATDVRTNIYNIGIGETGCGKENARNCIKKIIESCNVPTMNNICSVEEIASDTAIYNALTLEPSPVFLLDEVGRFLQTTKSNHNSHLYGIPSVLLKAYGSSNTRMYGKSYADVSKNISILQPNLCLYATSTPSQFFDSLSKENIEDGLVARMLIFESENPRPRTRSKVKKSNPPASLIEMVKKLYQKPINAYPVGNVSETTIIDPYLVPITADAFQMLCDFDDEIENLREKLEKQNRVQSMYNRCRLIAEKIAMIIAIGVNPDEPVIDPSHALYGIRLTKHLFDNLQYAVENFISNTEQERDLKKMLYLIRHKGKISVSDLTRKFQHMKTTDRKSVIQTLMDSEHIEEKWEIESETKRKRVYIAI